MINQTNQNLLHTLYNFFQYTKFELTSQMQYEENATKQQFSLNDLLLFDRLPG